MCGTLFFQLFYRLKYFKIKKRRSKMSWYEVSSYSVSILCKLLTSVLLLLAILWKVLPIWWNNTISTIILHKRYYYTSLWSILFLYRLNCYQQYLWFWSVYSYSFSFPPLYLWDHRMLWIASYCCCLPVLF